MARALVLLAALLLLVPGLFIAAKGLSALRRREAQVQGRTVTGAQAVFAGFILLGWATFVLAFAGLVLVRWISR